MGIFGGVGRGKFNHYFGLMDITNKYFLQEGSPRGPRRPPQTEGEVGAEDAGGEEEGLFVGSELIELLEGFIDGGAVWIGFIGTIEGLEEVHVFGVFSDFAIGEPVHPAAGMLPFFRGEEVTVP